MENELVIQYQFAVNNNGELVNIKNVDDSNRSGLFCPLCKNEMVAALGEKRVHYFRHKGEQPSTCNYEGYLHSLAERVFFEEYNKCLNEGTPFILSAKLPIKCNNACVLKRHADCPEHYVQQEIDLTTFFKKVYLEHSVSVPEANGARIRRPDILLETGTGLQIWVEIWVNHTDAKKKEERPVLEIRIKSEDDLQQFYNHRIEESPVGDDSVSLSKKSTLRRLVTKTGKVVHPLPCELYYVCDYDLTSNEPAFSKSPTVFSAEKGHYRVSLRLNWNESYLAGGDYKEKYDESVIVSECRSRAFKSVSLGRVPNKDGFISPLIVDESILIPVLDDYKHQDMVISDNDKKTIESRICEQNNEQEEETDNGSDVADNPQVASILLGLNDAQRKAVTTIDKPLLIVAGAGSGKTKVLTSRVAYILAKSKTTLPSEVLALTFTKKAAEEMKERISLLVGRKKARGLVMGTFHSVFVGFLREFADSKCLSYPKSFTIYDRSDSESAVKACVKELGLDEKVYKAREVLSRISFAKNRLLLPADYESSQDLKQVDSNKRMLRIKDIYKLYQNKLRENGVMDFDDILLNMNILLQSDNNALKSISSRFKYILVDEYQDTNYSQYLILKKLAAPHHNLCVVGDDSQSIYAFRGAQIQNILNFQKDYPESRIIRLERNYRSTRNIVDAANSVIAHNEGRIPKKCFSEGEEGEKIELIKSFTEQEEAVQIVSGIISRVMSEKAQYQDFAILYRTNSQSRALEEALRRKNIPYMIYSGNSFFDRAEIKDMMSWFKLCVNVNDDESFKRAVGKPSRGIGDTSISGLNELRRARGLSSLFAAVACEDYFEFLRPAAMQKIRQFCALVNKLAVAAASGDAFEVARQIYDESGLYAFYKADTSIEGMARTSNLDELLNSVQAFKEERLDDILADMDVDQTAPGEGEMPAINITLADFLETTSLLSNADTTDDDENGNNKVALMTVHSAKGLEFPYVYIAGAEENLFPSGGMLASPADVEEERRLFYVALTRAKKAVAVSFASTRMRNGKHESNSPSRFVKEIDPAYVANPLPADGFDGDDDDDSDMPFWFRNHSAKTTGYTRSGSGYGALGGSRFGSYGNYGRSGPARSYPSAPAKGPDRVPQGEPGSGIGWPKAYAQKAPASTTRVVPPVAKPDVIDPNFVPVPMKELYVGERVEHNRFGPGLIKEITGEFPELKAVIDFDNYGTKVLLLKYAKLRPENK